MFFELFVAGAKVIQKEDSAKLYDGIIGRVFSIYVLLIIAF